MKMLRRSVTAACRGHTVLPFTTPSILPPATVLTQRLSCSTSTAGTQASAAAAFAAAAASAGKARVESVDPQQPIIAGNPKYGVRDATHYTYISDQLVGSLSPRIRLRADAGFLLSELDMASARAVLYYYTEKRPGGHFVEHDMPFTMATVSFNSFMFTEPVFEGDSVCFSSRVLHVGSTSVGVHVSMHKRAFDCPTKTYLGECFVTFVTLCSNNLSMPAEHKAPAVMLSNESDKRSYALYVEMKKQQKGLFQFLKAATPADLSVEAVELPHNKLKKHMSTMKESQIRVDYCFNVTSINTNGVIFGGDLLRFMEKCALHCGRRFAGRERIFTLGMLDMTFDGAVLYQDAVSCFAHVSCVRGSTMLVDVRVDADCDGKRRSTNRASFLLVGTDPEGHTFQITRGLDLSAATEEELKVYWRARYRMEHASKNRHKYKNMK